MSPRPNVVRRFTAVWATSLAIKLAALALFVYVMLRLSGGLA